MNQIVNHIGTPFQEMKCWDVVTTAYEYNGVRLAPYTSYVESITNNWQEVEVMEEDDVLAYDLEGKGAITHVGVYIGDGLFIHSTKKVGVCIEEVQRYMNRLKGIYRYKGGESE